MNLNFKNKTVIITGGTRGIGKSLVHIFNDVGANVIITGTKKYNSVNFDLFKNTVSPSPGDTMSRLYRSPDSFPMMAISIDLR